MWDKAPTANVGGAYVVLGSDRPQGGELDDPARASAVRINGPSTSNSLVGFSVACAGDTTGDGYDDIAISDYVNQRVFVVYGSKRFTELNLDALGTRGRIVQAPADAGNFGYAVTGVGDLDRDGKVALSPRSATSTATAAATSRMAATRPGAAPIAPAWPRCGSRAE